MQYLNGKGMFEIKKKIVISDMDGTLLRSDKTISQKTIETVNELRKNNIDFTIATGRIYPVVLETVKTMNIKKPLILCNGALLQDPITEEVYFSKLLEDDIVHKILKTADESGCYFYYYTKDSICAKELKYTAKYYYEMNKTIKQEKKINIYLSPNLVNERKSNIYKVVVLEENVEKLKQVKQEMKKYDEYIDIVSSYWNNIEIVAKGVSKGAGVKFFAEKFDYEIENIMCIGDEENDESMLKVAGFPVAMGNASENMKKIAKYITSSNDNEGMSEAILKFAEL